MQAMQAKLRRPCDWLAIPVLLELVGFHEYCLLLSTSAECRSFAGKWLRAMGVDCTLVDSPSVEAIQAMLTEGRVFLSADRKLVDKREFQNCPVSFY
jgi:hypothetical protein